MQSASTDFEVIKIVVSVVAGGLAGAVLTYVTTQRRHKVDVTLKVIDYFFLSYSDIGHVKFTLNQNKTAKPANGQDENLVYRIADWYNLVAILYQKNKVDRKLLRDVGITSEMIKFANAANSTSWAEVVSFWPELDTFTRTFKR